MRSGVWWRLLAGLLLAAAYLGSNYLLFRCTPAFPRPCTHACVLRGNRATLAGACLGWLLRTGRQGGGQATAVMTSPRSSRASRWGESARGTGGEKGWAKGEAGQQPHWFFFVLTPIPPSFVLPCLFVCFVCCLLLGLSDRAGVC